MPIIAKARRTAVEVCAGQVHCRRINGWMVVLRVKGSERALHPFSVCIFYHGIDFHFIHLRYAH